VARRGHQIFGASSYCEEHPLHLVHQAHPGASLEFGRSGTPSGDGSRGDRVVLRGGRSSFLTVAGQAFINCRFVEGRTNYPPAFPFPGRGVFDLRSSSPRISPVIRDRLDSAQLSIASPGEGMCATSSKMFLTSALVIAVLAGVGILGLRAVDRLVSVNREITTRTLPALASGRNPSARRLRRSRASRRTRLCSATRATRKHGPDRRARLPRISTGLAAYTSEF